MKRLTLGRKVGERVRIKIAGVTFFVSAVDIHKGKVRLLFDAPAEVVLEREELPERGAA